MFIYKNKIYKKTRYIMAINPVYRDIFDIIKGIVIAANESSLIISKTSFEIYTERYSTQN